MKIGIWSRVTINRWFVCGTMFLLFTSAATDALLNFDAGDQLIMLFINTIGSFAWLSLSVMYGIKPAAPNEVVINVVPEG